MIISYKETKRTLVIDPEGDYYMIEGRRFVNSEYYNDWIQFKRVDEMYEVWVTQGQGEMLAETFPLLSDALAHCDAHKGEMSFAIKDPKGNWHKWDDEIKTPSE